MKRYDLRHLKDNFYDRMVELIDKGIKSGEVGIFLFEVGDFSSIQKSADVIRETGHDLMNSLKFNEVDWTVVVKKVDDETRKAREVKKEEARVVAQKKAEEERIAAEEKAKADAIAKEEAEAKAKVEAELKAKEEEAKAKEEAEAKKKEEESKAKADAKDKEEFETKAPTSRQTRKPKAK